MSVYMRLGLTLKTKSIFLTGSPRYRELLQIPVSSSHHFVHVIIGIKFYISKQEDSPCIENRQYLSRSSVVTFVQNNNKTYIVSLYRMIFVFDILYYNHDM